MAETEEHISEGFGVEFPPGVNVVLVGDLCLFSISGWRYLDGLWWRVGDDPPLSLAHEEALHHRGPTSIVGALEHRDEGGEAGRHSCLIFGEGVSLQTQNQVMSALCRFSRLQRKERGSCVRVVSSLGPSLLKALLATSYTVGRC